ncbi:L-rhamnose mutarotase [Pseudomonas duriflava]|uniref:L-rhamnose mutarotase n=1 Tax=Pseudomonas duriflava TaxID=459528 RepID=A0A562QPF3_9PSED|nr:L-rhamnose mutarotase [Pseudomonas duriflava]TWI58629.1 L-rhamnose mutarotase [Pseudomonas duriflava]
MNTRYCLALDLKEDPALIAEYERLHQRLWPEIDTHLRSAGIQDMQLYRLGTRLVMIMDVIPGFNFEAFDAAAAANPKVQEWEALMWRYQAPTPWTPEGSKWIPMQKIFGLADQPAPD